MKYDTAGNKIEEMIPNCDCGLTSGCEKCRPSFIGCISDEEAEEMKKKVDNFRDSFDKDIEKRGKKMWGLFEGAKFEEEDFDRGVRIPTKLYERLVNALENWLIPADTDQRNWHKNLLEEIRKYL